MNPLIKPINRSIIIINYSWGRWLYLDTSWAVYLRAYANTVDFRYLELAYLE